MVNVSRVIMSQSEQWSHLFVMLAKAGIQEFYIWIPASAGMTGNGNSFRSRLEVDVLLQPLAFQAREVSVISSSELTACRQAGGLKTPNYPFYFQH